MADIPTCDVCGRNDEGSHTWCGNCGCCTIHCQEQDGCREVVYQAIIAALPDWWTCSGCKYEVNGPMWGPDGLCRDCYEDQIPSQYCEQHGTYIGYAGGPDYLCGPCEMGE